MAFPTIVFNASTGSDTAASGAGPATALTGTGASLSASTTVDLSADAPDLSGVATDGTAALWVSTSSGRQFGRITAVDNTAKTVTVATAYSVTESGRTWAIGGKRATFDATSSRTVFTAGARAGWIVQTETNQTLTSVIALSSVSGDSTDGRIVVCGSGTNPRPIINQTANAACFSFSNSDLWEFKDLQFTNSNGTKTSASALSTSTSGTIVARSCIFGDATNRLLRAFTSGGGPIALFDCEIKSCTDTGLTNTSTSSNNETAISGCWIHDNGSHGVSTSNVTRITYCLIEDNGGDGVNRNSTGQGTYIYNTTLDGNTGDGLDLSNNAASSTGLVLVNNQFTNNGGYGINANSGSQVRAFHVDFNNFYGNSSGARNNLNAGANDLAVDPGYTNRATDDYSVGTSVKAKGYPGAGVASIGAGQSATTSYVDIGAAQRQETGGSGGVSRARILGGY